MGIEGASKQESVYTTITRVREEITELEELIYKEREEQLKLKSREKRGEVLQQEPNPKGGDSISPVEASTRVIANLEEQLKQKRERLASLEESIAS